MKFPTPLFPPKLKQDSPGFFDIVLCPGFTAVFFLDDGVEYEFYVLLSIYIDADFDS